MARDTWSYFQARRSLQTSATRTDGTEIIWRLRNVAWRIWTDRWCRAPSDCLKGEFDMNLQPIFDCHFWPSKNSGGSSILWFRMSHFPQIVPIISKAILCRCTGPSSIECKPWAAGTGIWLRALAYARSYQSGAWTRRTFSWFCRVCQQTSWQRRINSPLSFWSSMSAPNFADCSRSWCCHLCLSQHESLWFHRRVGRLYERRCCPTRPRQRLRWKGKVHPNNLWGQAWGRWGCRRAIGKAWAMSR